MATRVDPADLGLHGTREPAALATLSSMLFGDEPAHHVAAAPVAGSRSAAPPKASISASATAALAYIRITADDALGSLEASETPRAREATVAWLAAQVADAATSALEHLPMDAERRALLLSPANQAAEAVLRVHVWIRSRSPNDAMIRTFAVAERHIDALLRTLGTEPVLTRPEPALRTSEADEADAEQRDVVGAASALKNAIDAEQQMLSAGADQLFNSTLAKEANDTDVLFGLAESLVLAFAGNFFGPVLANLVKNLGRVSTEGAAGLKAQNRLDLYANVATDYLQGLAGTLVDAKKQSEEARDHKLLVYFIAAQQNLVTMQALKQKDVIDAALTSRSADPEQLRAARKQKEAESKGLTQRYAAACALEWSKLRAQSELGVRKDDASVSQMGDYFGERRASGRVIGTGKQGANGVARVSFVVDPETGTVTRDGDLGVVGSNQLVAEQVALNANGQLDRVLLPKEIYVTRKHARAVLAVDEKNRVCDVLDWELVADPNIPMLQEPERFWAQVRSTKV